MDAYEKLVDNYMNTPGVVAHRQELIDFLKSKSFQIMRIEEAVYAKEDVLSRINEDDAEWFNALPDKLILDSIEDNESDLYWDCYWDAVKNAIIDLKEDK